MSAEKIADFERIPTMIRCSHLDAIIIFYNVSSLKQFESIHQKVTYLLTEVYNLEYQMRWDIGSSIHLCYDSLSGKTP